MNPTEYKVMPSWFESKTMTGEKAGQTGISIKDINESSM